MLVETMPRIDSDYFESLRNFHTLKNKRIFFSDTLLADIAVYKSLGESHKFIVKTNINDISSKRIERLEKHVLEMAEKYNSQELIIDLTCVNSPDRSIIYDVTNKTRLVYFSSFYPKNVKSDMLVIYQEKTDDGKFTEDQLGCLAVDSDKLQSLATFQNINCRISRTDFPIKKYGSESAYKLFCKLMGLEFKIPTHVDIGEYLLEDNKIGCEVSDERKVQLMEIFSTDDIVLKEREDIIDGELMIVDGDKISLTEIVSRGEVPSSNKLQQVSLDFEIGWIVKDCYIKSGWLYFVIDDTDGKFWEDYYKNRDELLETLGGLDDKVSIMKYKLESTSLFKLGKDLEEDDDDDNDEWWGENWGYY